MTEPRPSDRSDPEAEPEQPTALPDRVDGAGHVDRTPPGVFSLEQRPVPALYLAAWVLALSGLALIAVGLLASSRTLTPLLVLAGIALLGVGFASGAAYQIVVRRGRPVERYRGPSPLLLFGIVAAFSQLIVGPIVLFGLNIETTSGAFIGLLAIFVSYYASVTLFVVRTGALSWREMGWQPLTLGRVAADTVIAVAIMPAALIVIGLIASVITSATNVQLQSPLPQPRGTLDVFALVLSAAVLAPIGEELFFRGFSLSAWQRDLGPRSALVRSSVFFAAAHLVNLTASSGSEGLTLALVTFAYYLPLGAILGALFQTRGLLASILGHATANGTVVLISLLARGAQA